MTSKWYLLLVSTTCSVVQGVQHRAKHMEWSVHPELMHAPPYEESEPFLRRDVGPVFIRKVKANKHSQIQHDRQPGPRGYFYAESPVTAETLC